MRKIWKVVMAFCLMLTILPTAKVSAATPAEIKIDANSVSADGSKDHLAKNIVDGNTSTYWQSMAKDGEGDSDTIKKETRMSDHNRYIDIKLDGTYDLTEIKMFPKVDGSYSNYYVYASEDGSNFDKIISKTNKDVSTASGETYAVTKRAAYIRINMAYNSNSFPTNLAEIKVSGLKASDTVRKPAPISTTSWEDSEWKTEWDKVESNTTYAKEKTISEMSDLVGRVIGSEWKASFKFEYRSALNGEDTYEILNGDNNTIIIRGNNGVAMASGFNYYLKNFAMVDYNPLYGSNTEMKKGIVKVNEKIIKTTQYDYRYALNFCTYSYTMAFWNWEQYEAFLDWGAMNGVNLMLDIVGQEEVIRQLLRQYNYTDEEIKDYISGPGYFAWFYMQNLYSFGGPLPDSWFEQRVELGRKMHDRMQTYGITPVIQGFSGQVPLTFDDKNDGAVLTKLDEWPTFTRPAIVTPYLSSADQAAGKKNYFPEMAQKFYEVQENVFGQVSNYYAADPFHEGGNTEGLNKTEIYKQVQTEMLKYDEKAIWVMQQWQWNLDGSKLSGLVKPEQGLALDLQSDLKQQNSVMEENKVPWIWNMLHNFGGRMGLDGELEVTATKLPQDFQNSKYMKGIGITPEALENSPVAYEMLFDMTWTKDPIDYQEWVAKYAERRAGGTSEKLQEAWKTLSETAYAKKGNYFQGAAETIINATPRTSFSSASTWGHSEILYDKKELETALQLLVDNYDAFKASDAFTYDLADVSEQVLCNAAIEYHGLMINALNENKSDDFKEYSKKFMEIIEISDRILSSNQEFMVGTWIDDARTMLDDMDDWTKDLFEFNARALVTTWGGERSTSLNDYSNRKWAGLTKDYYGERWKIWIANRQAELDKTAKDPENTKAESNWFMWGWRWANLKSDDGFAYETKASTETLKADAQKVLDQYSVTELEKNGGTVSGKVNIALGKVFTTTSSAQEGALKDITDGTTSTNWTANGAGPHVLTLDLEGTYKITDMTIAIKQAATTYPFTYKVEYLNEEGSWVEYSSEATAGMQSNTNITKDATASQIRLTMSTSNVETFPIFLAEVSIFGTPLNVTKYINVAKGLTATSTIQTDSASSLAYITDENTKSLWKTIWSGSESAMYPCDVTLDLGGKAEAEFIELYLEKAGLPYKFTVGVVDDKGVETIVLDESGTTETLENAYYKIPMNKKQINKVIVHYIGRTGKGTAGAASPAMSELKVLSTKEVDVKKNYALNKSVTATSTQAGVSTANAVDGNLDTAWNFNGFGYSFWDGTSNSTPNPILFTVDLGGAYTIDEVNLFMKKDEPKYYFFDVYVFKEGSADRTKVLSVTPDDVTADKANLYPYKIPVNDRITKVEVEFRGKVSGKNGWYDIAELEAIGSEKQTQGVILKEGKITSVSKTPENTATLDGDKGTYISGIKDKEVIYSLGGNYYVDYVDFTFEKPGLGLKYVIYAEDENGNRSLVLDRSNSTSLLENATVKVDVKQIATKIIFKHLGNNGKGSMTLADPRLYETEIYSGIPVNAAKDGVTNPTAAQAIVDGDKTKGHTLVKNDVVTVDFNKATDINMFNIITDNKVAGKYKLELYNVDKKAWEQVYDGSDNTKLGSDFFIKMDASVFADKVRITVLNDSLNVLELNAYAVDKTGPLNVYIEEVQLMLKGKSYDGTNGSYTVAAKEKVEAILKQAQDAAKEGMNSATVNEWMTKIKAAVKEFTSKGVVFINRATLLRELSNTETVIAEAKKLGNSVITTTIEKNYETAFATYKVYAITQTAVNEAATTLKTARDTFVASLEVVDQYKVELALAEKTLSEAVVGNLAGQVTQASKDTLQAVITKAKADFATASQEDMKTIVSTLKAAIETFNKSRVVIDRAPLLAMIQKVGTLKQQNYDMNSWKTMKDVQAEVQKVYDKEAVSQEMITTATSQLNKAINDLVTLDRAPLRAILDSVTRLNKTEYTADSWKALTSVNTAAIAVYNKVSLTQNALDAEVVKVQAAIDALKKVTPPEPGTDVTITNKGTGVSVSAKLPSGVTLESKLFSKEQTAAIARSIKDKTYASKINVEKVFELTLMKSGKVYTHNGMMTVKLPIPSGLQDKTLRVIYIADDGSVQEFKSVRKGGYLIFETSHFSKFAIVSVKDGGTTTKPGTTPSKPGSNGSNSGTGGSTNSGVKTGDTTNASALLLFCAMGLSGMAVVYSKKRKAKKAN